MPNKDNIKLQFEHQDKLGVEKKTTQPGTVNSSLCYDTKV